MVEEEIRLGVMGVEGVVDRTVVSQRGNDSTNELLSVYLEDMRLESDQKYCDCIKDQKYTM